MRYYANGNSVDVPPIGSDDCFFMRFSNGMKWINFGDSLTAPGMGSGTGVPKDIPDHYGGMTLYLSKVAEDFGLTLDNRAVGGSKIYTQSVQDSGNNGISKLNALIASDVVPDYITIAYNGNVFASTIGNPTDTASDYIDSTYGATRYFIENIRTHYPRCIFAFVLPYLTAESTEYGGNHYYSQANAVTRELCAEYGVPYLDLEKRGNINVTTDLPQDGIHPTSASSQIKCYHAWRGFFETL